MKEQIDMNLEDERLFQREQIEITTPESIVTDKGIYGFFGQYRFLSNFHLINIEIDGRVYPSTENAYMAFKTDDVILKDEFTKILPKEAKTLGRNVPLRSDWEEVKFECMRRVLVEKFKDEKLKTDLLNTGDKYLEETNWWGDQIWGVCKNKGANNLGKLLMEIRKNENQ